MSQILGIDVSHYQGTVNYANVKAAGKNFVIAKISQYKLKDDTFEKNYANAVGKVNFGGYIYNTAKSVEQAKIEAEFAVSVIKGKKLNVGVWLDMEDSIVGNLPQTTLTSIIETEASIIKAAGFSVGIYCNMNWYNNKIASALRTKYPFWIARYPASDNGTIVASLSPEGKTGVVAWQYSSKGKVSGISGNVDMDIAFKDLVGVMGGSSSTSSASSSDIVIAKMSIVKGDTNQFAQIVKNIKLALNTDYGLAFNTSSATVDDVLLANLGNVLLTTSAYKKNITYALQQLLKWWGYSLTVDGIYGSDTSGIVKTFQMQTGLTQTGTTTKEFWTKILGK